MRIPNMLLPMFGAAALLVSFVYQVATVLVALYVWDRWFKRR